ncbi:hypothetical protein HaLaN_00923 [Haematococcus lacustris]|uniref:Uncharacterized protein n=1 Tax=Haematococcus lacustris TaxID=44745 RepID=A0A699Y8B9_HAELA|nr:hypothetical protein HaLaN_00923 [Haematococcus lacustris]
MSLTLALPKGTPTKGQRALRPKSTPTKGQTAGMAPNPPLQRSEIPFRLPASASPSQASPGQLQQAARLRGPPPPLPPPSVSLVDGPLFQWLKATVVAGQAALGSGTASNSTASRGVGTTGAAAGGVAPAAAAKGDTGTGAGVEAGNMATGVQGMGGGGAVTKTVATLQEVPTFMAQPNIYQVPLNSCWLGMEFAEWARAVQPMMMVVQCGSAVLMPMLKLLIDPSKELPPYAWASFAPRV